MYRITQAALLDRFHAICTSSDVAAPKPAPDVYLLAAQRLGVEPARCLVLEDSPTGVRAALVVLGSSMRDDVLIAALLKASRSVPIVMTNANLAAENTFCIERDDAAGIRLAMARLMDRGCRSLCFVSDYLYYSDHYKQQVFMDIADAFGLKHIYCSQTEETPRAEGYVCSSDMAAAKLLKSLAPAGIRIPDDALAVGYDNTDLAPLLTPTLTSIDSDINRQSQIAADTLQALLMDGVRPQNHVLITPTLVIRESA